MVCVFPEDKISSTKVYIPPRTLLSHIRDTVANCYQYLVELKDLSNATPKKFDGYQEPSICCDLGRDPNLRNITRSGRCTVSSSLPRRLFSLMGERSPPKKTYQNGGPVGGHGGSPALTGGDDDVARDVLGRDVAHGPIRSETGLMLTGAVSPKLSLHV